MWLVGIGRGALQHPFPVLLHPHFSLTTKLRLQSLLRLACSAAFRSTTGTPISFYMLSVPASTEKLTCGMQAATQCCRMCSCFVFWWIIPLLAFTKTFLSCMHKSRTTQHLKLCYKAVKPRALGTFQDWTCVRGDCCVFFIT